MQRNETRTTTTGTTTDAGNLDTLDCLARRAPATNDLLALANWLTTNGAAHLSAIERIELAERLITRRRFLIGAGALGLGIITGCGAGDEVPAAEPTDALVVLVEETEEGRVIAYLRGETVVPHNPQRIVALNVGESLLALDVVPMMVMEYTKRRAHLADLLVDVASVGFESGLDLEGITAAQPDLILMDDSMVEWADGAELVAQIAPTIAVSNPSYSFRQTLRDIGVALGLKEEAEARIATFDEAAQQASERIADLIGDDTVALVNVTQDSIRLYGIELGYFGPVLYGELGITPAALVEELVPAEDWHVTISLESLADLDADYIFVFAPDSQDQQYEEFTQQAIWQRVPAVQAGNSYRVSSDYWASVQILGNQCAMVDAVAKLGGSEDAVSAIAPDEIACP